MELTPIYKSAIGLGHHGNITACALIGQADGGVHMELAEFGGFKKDRKALAKWVQSFLTGNRCHGKYGYLLETPLLGFGKTRHSCARR